MRRLSWLIVAAVLLAGGATQAQMFDITNPGDPVVGVPNPSNWPAGEEPPGAIDNVVTVKYLCFETAFVNLEGAVDTANGGAGFRVTPSGPKVVVKALNFASANDSPERDPVAFRLSGSDESINGPYTLIAEGTIDAFDQTTTFARNTWIPAPIPIINKMAYTYYELFFTDIRDRAPANSMQIGEVELLSDGSSAGSAGDPVPADGTVDVPRDVVLSWLGGQAAATHDVYFGTSFDDVNDATQPTQSVTNASYDPEGLLEYGQTYYWRVDEVNGAPDYTVFKGDTWSFTAETYAYPITAVTAEASSAQPASPASKTINGAGLDEFDQHGVDLKTMWVTPGGLPAWIEYTFDKAYTLNKLMIWNANSELELFMGFGAKTVTIEYSTDGETWAQLENVPEFAKGTGAPTYTANTTVDFGGIVAQYVRLTVTATWGATGIASLSEVRFFYTPVQAFGPEPADGATDIALGTTLNWRPGREATSHEVGFGADPDALTTQTVTAHNYTPASMNFGTKYYWKVDEVGDAGTYEGALWSFTAQEFAPIDDFEGYDDNIETETTIWNAWTDGVTTLASGSQVGYTDSPFAEQTIVHSGKQSMPFLYDNVTTFSFSEASREFEAAQNWTGNGATEVALWTQGYPALAATTVTETSGKMTLTGAGTDIWNNSDEFTFAYKTLAGDGTMIARVVSNGTGTNTWAKGGVMIRDSLWGGSTHAMMVMTGGGGNGASFQYRATANAASGNTDSTTAIAPPYWVKIERAADTFKGSVSIDGKAWTVVGTTIIAVTDPVYVGLAVTSGAVGVDRTFQFDSISSTGTITGAWQGAVIDNPRYNDPANMHLYIEDSAGKSGTVTSATAVTAADWTRWVIPMSDFAGVNFAKVKKMVITIGDKNATAAGGTGIVFIDDIGFGRSAGQ
ncbi:MAG: discoidin domain-containing protein [Phycisphaerales bacterium]